MCWYASESRPHPLKPALQCLGVWARTHCCLLTAVPLLVGWKLYIPHQSCHSCIIHTPLTQTHAFSSLDSWHLISRVGGMVIFFFSPQTTNLDFVKVLSWISFLIDFNKCDHFYRIKKHLLNYLRAGKAQIILGYWKVNLMPCLFLDRGKVTAILWKAIYHPPILSFQPLLVLSHSPRKPKMSSFQGAFSSVLRFSPPSRSSVRLKSDLKDKIVTDLLLRCPWLPVETRKKEA